MCIRDRVRAERDEAQRFRGSENSVALVVRVYAIDEDLDVAALAKRRRNGSDGNTVEQLANFGGQGA